MALSTRIGNLIRRNALGFAALFAVLGGTAIASSGPPKNSIGEAQIKPGAVGASELAKNAVTSVSVKDRSIFSEDLAFGSLDESLFAPSVLEKLLDEATVDTQHIVDGAVTGSKIASDTVTTFDVENQSLTGTDIQNASIQAVDLAENIGQGLVADGSITSAKLADLAVITAKLADGSVTTPKLADLAVTTPKLGNDAVTGAKVANGALTAADIANAASGSDDVNADLLDGLNSSQLQQRVSGSCPAAQAVRSVNADGTVACEPVTGGGGSGIDDGAVTTAKLADGAVTSQKIADATIGVSDLAANSVGSAQVATDSLGASDLAPDSVGVSEFATPPAVSVTGTLTGGTGFGSGTPLPLTFTEVFDFLNMFAPATPTRVIAPVTGLYQVDISAKTNSPGVYTIRGGVTRNGAAAFLPGLEIREQYNPPVDGSTADSPIQHASGLLQLNAGDFLELRVGVIESGGGVTHSGTLQAYLVAGT